MLKKKKKSRKKAVVAGSVTAAAVTAASAAKSYLGGRTKGKAKKRRAVDVKQVELIAGLDHARHKLKRNR